MDVLGIGVAIHAQGVAVVASRSDGAARHMTVKVQITVDVDVLDVYVAVDGARHPAAVHVEPAVGVGVDVGEAAKFGAAGDIPRALPFDGAAQHVVENRAARGGETAQIHPRGPVERAAAQNGHVLEVGARGGVDVSARVDGGVRHHHGGVVDGEVLRVDVAGRGGAVRDRAADEGPFGQRVVGGLTGVGVRHFLPFPCEFRMRLFTWFNGYRFKGSGVANRRIRFNDRMSPLRAARCGGHARVPSVFYVNCFSFVVRPVRRGVYFLSVVAHTRCAGQKKPYKHKKLIYHNISRISSG